MTPQEQEIKKVRSEIKKEIKAVFKVNMKIFNWNIPENDDRRSAELIFAVMQKTMDTLKQEIEAGKYDQY